MADPKTQADTSSLVARLGAGVSAWDLEVVATSSVTPGVVAGMRRTLLELGLTPEQISAKPYWRVGRANAAHGEPERP
jgi:hypothetical protein